MSRNSTDSDFRDGQEADLGTGVRVIETLPFEIQPQAAETTAAIITAELPEQIAAP